MKKITFILLSLFILLMINSCKKASEKSQIIRSSKFKESILESRKDIVVWMFQNEIPGVSLAVYLDNKVIWSDGFGYACKELNVAVKPETKFRIGGTSKLFTGALVASLVQQGVLDMNAKVRSYYPELPQDKGLLTLNHLASNTSGIRGMTYEENTKSGYLSMRNGISAFIKDSLLFQPGQQFLESDYNYDLIGASLERKFNKRFPVLLKKMTDTLHLKSTMCDDPTWIIDNLGQCYDRNLVAKTIRSITVDNRHRAASVGLVSTSLDIATMANEYLFPKYLKKETIETILKPTQLPSGEITSMGLGIEVSKDMLGRDLYTMLGSTRGGSSCLVVYPHYKLVISMACNIGEEEGSLPILSIASRIIDQIDPQQKQKEEKK